MKKKATGQVPTSPEQHTTKSKYISAPIVNNNFGIIRTILLVIGEVA